MTDARTKIAKLRMAEMGVGFDEPAQTESGRETTARKRPYVPKAPMWEEEEPVIAVARKGDDLTEAMIGSVADDVRDAFLDAAADAGFVLRNEFSKDTLHEMVTWLMRLNFVKGGKR